MNPQAKIFLPGSSRGSGGTSDVVLLYTIDGGGGVPSIPVYETCLTGACSCTHVIGGASSQLKPCRFASFISGETNVMKGRPLDSEFIWEGVTRGFKIVDDTCNTSYTCRNYNSILEGAFYEEMCTLVQQEEKEGLVTKVLSKPRCLNAMGAVEKSNGKLRPITDCSMPEEGAINRFMSTTYTPFSYNSVNSVVDLLRGGGVHVSG